VDLGALIIPLIFSFHPKLNFYEKWKSTLLSIFVVGLFFIIWDIAYTDLGVWGFNPQYLSGIYIYNLPIEEILFFICIPYACLFTYHCLKIYKPITFSESTKWITYKLSISLFVIGLLFLPNLYTSVTFISLSAILFVIQIKCNPVWLPRLYTSLLILILPFFIVNGILTGTGLENPIVWYNENEITGFRILTIPVEDFFYGFLLILLNVFFLEQLDEKFSKKNI
jgi:lycopene cyclase domain-containing protein